MVVAPGFIDMLGQSELTILVNPHLPSKIYQGITTEITGEGSSIAPLNDAIVKADHVTYEHYGVQPDWRTFREYFARLRKQGMGINLASYVGATQVRRMVLGDDNRAPTAAELERMKALVREAMREGAVGVSTSLQYAPAPYAKTEELIALAAEAAQAGRHLRLAHPRRGRRDSAGARRGHPHRARGADSGRDLAPEGGRQIQLGPHAGDRGAHRAGAQIGRGYGGRYLRLPGRRSTPFRRSFRRGRTMAATRS